MPNPSSVQANREPAHSTNLGLADALLALYQDAFRRHQAGRFAEAAHLYEWIASFKADLPDVQNNLGHALWALGRTEAAIAAFERATQTSPDFPDALCNWGLALADLERFDEAEAKYRHAIRINPRCGSAYNNLGLLLKEQGRLTEAQEAFERAVALEPTNFAGYDNLASLRRFAAGDPHLTALEAAADNPTAFSVADQIHLHFALAKIQESLDRPERAFRHHHTANRLKRRQIAYDEAVTLGRMDRLRKLISREFIQARQGCGEPSARPVFIVGMTRSGTTLIEQILASHPQVFGAGELPLFDQVAGSMRNTLSGLPAFPDMMLAMAPAHFRTLGALYALRIAQRAPAAQRITDKMTMNFLFVGLIHLALPNATIIHAVRDPADTCLSCFTTHFTRGQEHTYDLAELGRYYRHYRELMAHWHDILPPGRIMDVRYEELVADPENTARRIVSHCGLAWDPRCLDFHRTERAVRTASAIQVRRPIYRDSVGRWRKYQAFLEPLLAELAPLTATADGVAKPAA